MFSTGDESEPSVTDFEGRYRLRGVTADVELAVKASADGFDDAKSEPFTVSKGSIKEGVDVQFAEPGSLRIEVEGGTGMLLGMVRRKDASAGTPPRVEALTGGSAEIKNLAPGTFTVTIQSTGGEELELDPASVEVEVKAGETATASFQVK